MSQIDWTDIVAAAVALYGALLSTYNLVVQLRKNRPRINVKIEMGFLANGRGYTSEPMVILSASNAGEKAVTLGSYGFMLPGKKVALPLQPHMLDVRFPHELLPEKQCRIHIPSQELATGLRSEGFSGKVRLIGFYRDQVGRVHRSKRWRFDMDG